MKQTEQKHSQEPWELVGELGYSGYPQIVKRLPNRLQVLTDMANVEVPPSVAAANSARIVSCVNAMAGLDPAGVRELVEAAEAVLADLESGWIHNDAHRAEVNRRKKEEMLRAALKKIKGDA